MIKKFAVAVAVTGCALTVAAAPASAHMLGTTYVGEPVWCVQHLHVNPSTGLEAGVTTRGHIYQSTGRSHYETVCDGHKSVMVFMRNGCSAIGSYGAFAMPRGVHDNRERSTFANVCY